MRSGGHLAMSKARAVPSSEALTSTPPARENWSAVTGAVCSVKVIEQKPLDVLQRRTRASSPPVASTEPSSLYAQQSAEPVATPAPAVCWRSANDSLFHSHTSSCPSVRDAIAIHSPDRLNASELMLCSETLRTTRETAVIETQACKNIYDSSNKSFFLQLHYNRNT